MRNVRNFKFQTNRKGLIFNIRIVSNFFMNYVFMDLI